MAQAKQGDRVRLSYVGKLPDGTIFDSSEECEDEGCGCEDGPMEFTVGSGEVLPALEQAVIGMRPGERRTVLIAAEDAYGDRNEEMVVEVERNQLPDDLKPHEGQVLELTDEEAGTFPVWVIDVGEETITLDANHPLAGQDLTFDLELLEVNPTH